MLDCMQDVIDALQPRYLSPKSDEWWHKRRPGEEPDERLRGKTRAQAFLDLHVKLDRWLQARGITMLLFHDMLTPYHNGKRYDLYRTIDRFPKDAIIQLWSAGHTEKDLRWFTGRGFRVWVNGTGFVPIDAETRVLVSGYGKGLYSFGGCRSGLLDRFSHLQSMGSLIHSADYAWNLARREGESLNASRLVALCQLLARRPNPQAGRRTAALDMDMHLTHGFGAFLREVKPKDYGDGAGRVALPAGLRDVGGIPTRFGQRDGKDCIVLRKGDGQAALPIGGRHASLIFLHTAYVNNPKDAAIAGAKVRRWMYGWPCGEYVVHWDDGTHAVLPVRLTLNVKRFDTSARNRATNDNRYVWTLPDGAGRSIHLYQWEWANPTPERAIVKLVARHDNELDVTLILFAVSTRELREDSDRNTADGIPR
jgi:hypothetical protein